jgi:hypothetical protein
MLKSGNKEKMMKLFYMIILIFSVVMADVVPQDFSANQVDARLKKMNGDTAEYVMNKLLRKNGWNQINGEVGKNGIDGLFVKYDKNGNIKQVMVAESKYGTSQLGTGKYGTNTANVKQMSQKALQHQVGYLIKDIDRKLQNAIVKNEKDEIIKYRSLEKKYTQISKYIYSGNYRARLFNLKTEGNILSFKIKKILPNGETSVLKQSLLGRENYKFNNLKMDFNNPKTAFEKSLVKYYKYGRYEALRTNFNFSAIEAKVLLDKRAKLSEGDIERVYGMRKAVKNAIEREYRSTLRRYKPYYSNINKLKTKIHTKWMKKYWKVLKRRMK